MENCKGQQLDQKVVKFAKGLMVSKKGVCPSMANCKGQQLNQKVVKSTKGLIVLKKGYAIVWQR